MMRFVWLVLCGAFLVGAVQAQNTEQEYMAVFIKGERVGYHNKVRKVYADSVVTTEFMTFTVKTEEGNVEKLSIDEFVETREGALIRFRHEAAQGSRLFRIVGKRQGAELHLSLISEKQKHERVMGWSDATLLPEARRLLMKHQGLKLGTEYTFEQLFPETLAFGDVKVTVGPVTEVDVLGEKMELIETHETIYLQGRTLEYIVYREASTRPRKVIAPAMFMEMVSCSEAFAMTPLDEN